MPTTETIKQGQTKIVGITIWLNVDDLSNAFIHVTDRNNTAVLKYSYKAATDHTTGYITKVAAKKFHFTLPATATAALEGLYQLEFKYGTTTVKDTAILLLIDVQPASTKAL